MRVWVTRAQPGAEATAGRLRALGHAPLVAPVLQIRPVRAELDLTGVAALAFTSANGVDAFAAAEPLRDLPVFAVGDATARAAWGAGFADVRSAQGDVEALAALILASRSGLDGAVLHPGGRDLAGGLVVALADGGQSAHAVAVYEAAAVAPEPAVLAVVAGADAVLVHSPRAAGVVARLPQARGLAVLCISPAAAEIFRTGGFSRVASAARPDEASLLALLDDTP